MTYSPDTAPTGLEALRTGTIIRANIPSISARDGTLILYSRTSLVLGVEGVKNTDCATGLFLARLSTSADQFENQQGPVVPYEDFYTMGIHGMTSDIQLRTERVDLLPAHAMFLGESVRLLGCIDDADTMEMIGRALLRGMKSEYGEGGRGPRGPLKGSVLRQEVCYGLAPVFPEFPLQDIVRQMLTLLLRGKDDYERAFRQAGMQHDLRRFDLHTAFLKARDRRNEVGVCEDQTASAPACGPATLVPSAP
ncbi:MAG: hypothetical protein H6865_02155 [Rhodospirillales bacterium]|nr:hypothetical protein [Alphaproteobacteria bacterium]MCB9986418.1 hypothetical protein [Rhodospirillales bacterium]USO07036.1 MAG: hypothetical protein H6866_06230 [Rhodospirillales bacterium]